MAAVDVTKEHIQAGDIFQLVLSQRFERRTQADPFEIYRRCTGPLHSRVACTNGQACCTGIQHWGENAPAGGTQRSRATLS